MTPEDLAETERLQLELGPCIRDLCTGDAVVYVHRTVGRSPRLTFIAGRRAVELAEALPEAVMELVCASHAAEELDELLRAENAALKTATPAKDATS